MRVFEYETGGYKLVCSASEAEKEAGVIVTGYKGSGSNLDIPDVVEGFGETYKVTAIGKKAFMACTVLRNVSIPGTVSTIGDWAFAGCRQLRTVIFRGSYSKFRSIDIATGVFSDCMLIENICIASPEENDLSFLLAVVIHRMKAEYLLKDVDLGHHEWYGKWDMALDIYLDQKDDEGYTDLILCGEEDWGTTPEKYINNVRRNKAMLCFVRLMHDVYLDRNHRHKFETYLLEKGKNKDSDEAWQILRDELSDKVEYFRLYADIGGISEEVIDDMLIGLGEQHAEAKAFLIRYKQEKYNKTDIFDSFTL